VLSQVTSVPVRLARIAEVEDARGTQGRSVEHLVPFLFDGNSEVRAAAVRAVGRLQSPELLARLYPALRDPSAAVRVAAVNAMAQSLKSGHAASHALAAAVLDSLSRGTPGEAGWRARAIGRLPWRDSSEARRAERAILMLAGTAPAAQQEHVLHGLYALARQRRALGAPSAEAVRYATAAVARRAVGEAAARTRRLGWLTLAAAGAVPRDQVPSGLSDADDQVRRLVLVAAATTGDTALLQSAIHDAARDPSFLVRFEAVRLARAFVATQGCALLIDALGDANAHVALAAIDGLSSRCRDRGAAAEAILALIDANRSDSPVRARGRSGWHVHAHALVALARTAPERALPVVRRDATSSPLWTVRAWSARAATVLGDTTTLWALARDADGNVRDLALRGLSGLVGHAADSLFVAALAAREYQVVMAGAQLLKGTPRAAEVVPVLLQHLDRLTSERRENTRDAREALLERLDELGRAENAPQLEPLRTDFDSTIAGQAARTLSRWTGRDVRAQPVPLPLPREDVATLMTGRWFATFTMSPASGGGSFEAELHPRSAPYTVARFVRLARAGYYNGLTFHRVEPAFVIQGGSPAATEYVGDGPFMRDELDTASHLRGTLGISTRGRDTGDAQVFVNLTDNVRLDHDYTVFGTIWRGRAVAEAVLEADVIDRVTIRRSSR
jgi:cyclophilin family peptidyl-prolyl cis-trans isomerase